MTRLALPGQQSQRLGVAHVAAQAHSVKRIGSAHVDQSLCAYAGEFTRHAIAHKHGSTTQVFKHRMSAQLQGQHKTAHLFVGVGHHPQQSHRHSLCFFVQRIRYGVPLRAGKDQAVSTVAQGLMGGAA